MFGSLSSAQHSADSQLHRLPILFVLTDERGTISFASAFLAEKLGRSSADLVGQSLSDIAEPESGSYESSGAWAGTWRHDSVALVDATGARQTMFASTRPILDGSETARNVTLFTDTHLTGQEGASRIVGEHVAVLRALVADYTIDLNNALTVIQRSIEMTLEATDDPLVIMFSKDAAGAVTRAMDLTHQLAEMASPARADGHLNLRAFLEKLRPALLRLMPSRLALEIHAGADVNTIMPDPMQFRLAVIAIVNHVSKAINSDGLLRVDARIRDLDGDLLNTAAPDLQAGRYVVLCVTTNRDPFARLQELRPVAPVDVMRLAGGAVNAEFSLVNELVRPVGGALAVAESGPANVALFLPVYR